MINANWMSVKIGRPFSTGIIRGKHSRGNISSKVVAFVFSRWRGYVRHFRAGKLATLSINSIRDSNKRQLLSCYSSKTKHLDSLKASIRKEVPKDFGNTCIYCGISEASTFDHYLPKEVFPEFSVLRANLIPSCGVCNQHKGLSWAGSKGQRVFSPTWKRFTDTQFLIASINKNSSGFYVTFDYSFPATISGADQCCLREHVDQLKLIPRFEFVAQSELESLRSQLKALLKTTKFSDENVMVMRAFIGSLISDRENRGVNSWQYVLLKAVRASTDFLEEVEKEALTELLEPF